MTPSKLNAADKELFGHLPPKVLNQLERKVKRELSKECGTIKSKFYIEHQYVQDIYLGAILSLLQNEDEYQYVLDELPHYNNRLGYDRSAMFPKLGLTDEGLREYIGKPEYTLPLLRTSPLTTAYSDLFHTLVDIHLQNLRLSSTFTDPYKFYINVYPISLKERFYPDKKTWRTTLETIKRMYASLLPNTEVLLIDYPTKDVPFKVISRMHLLMLEKMKDVFDPSVREKEHFYFAQGGAFDTTVATPKRLDDDIPRLYPYDDGTDAELTKRFELGHATLNLIAQFTYLNPEVIVQQQLENKLKPESTGD